MRKRIFGYMLDLPFLLLLIIGFIPALVVMPIKYLMQKIVRLQEGLDEGQDYK